MRYTFSKRSSDNLHTCHEDLQKICRELIMMYDFSVIEGHRSLEKQQKYFKEGKSKLDGIKLKSKHQGEKIPNPNPHNVCRDSEGKIIVDEDGDPIWSMAVDIMPYKKGTNAFSGDELDSRRFYMMMGMVKAIVHKLMVQGEISHNVRFGLDWDGDELFSDQTFHDLPHIELI